MQPNPLRRTARIVSCVVLAMISLQFSASPARAAEDASSVVIRYLNDRGYVPPYEIADALGFWKGMGIRLEPEGDSPGGPESLAALALDQIVERGRVADLLEGQRPEPGR
jgi:hypothetical protein